MNTANLIRSLINSQYDQPTRHRLMNVVSFSDWYFRVARRDMIAWHNRNFYPRVPYRGNYRLYSRIRFNPYVYNTEIMRGNDEIIVERRRWCNNSEEIMSDGNERCVDCGDVLNMFDWMSYNGECENCYAKLYHPEHYCRWYY